MNTRKRKRQQNRLIKRQVKRKTKKRGGFFSEFIRGKNATNEEITSKGSNNRVFKTNVKKILSSKSMDITYMIPYTIGYKNVESSFIPAFHSNEIGYVSLRIQPENDNGYEYFVEYIVNMDNQYFGILRLFSLTNVNRGVWAGLTNNWLFVKFDPNVLSFEYNMENGIIKDVNLMLDTNSNNIIKQEKQDYRLKNPLIDKVEYYQIIKGFHSLRLLKNDNQIPNDERKQYRKWYSVLEKFRSVELIKYDVKQNVTKDLLASFF